MSSQAKRTKQFVCQKSTSLTCSDLSRNPSSYKLFERKSQLANSFGVVFILVLGTV